MTRLIERALKPGQGAPSPISLRKRTKPHLKKRMSRDDSQEPLESFTSSINDLIREPIREDFSGERRDVDSCRFAFENVPEGFEIRVTATDEGVAQFEGGDISLCKCVSREWQ